MSSSEYSVTFWNKLENEMHQTLPEVVKIILAATGFESEICLQNVTSGDILNIENYIDRNKIQWMQKYAKLFGSHSKKSKFKLLPGHSKIISEISEHYKKMAVIANESAQRRKNRIEAEAETGYKNVCFLAFCLYSF